MTRGLLFIPKTLTKLSFLLGGSWVGTIIYSKMIISIQKSMSRLRIGVNGLAISGIIGGGLGLYSYKLLNNLIFLPKS